jgi:hypothetical protein
MDMEADQTEGSTEEDSDADDVKDDSVGEEVEKPSKQTTPTQGEYELQRQKNLNDLKKKLHELNEKYPIPCPKDSGPKQANKSALKRKGTGEPVTVVRRESKRNKGRQYV